MSELPIQHLTVSDFRRIEGTRDFPLDAPVVLIHGPNGTGKTSILSALELALTGNIRSMERQSDRYRAHLPFLGQPYATVRADVAQEFQAGIAGVPLTVSGARLEGSPAFSETASKFYAERCYLDQTSLGRLLDLYQARESNGQSALEVFVNELLGLEKLDALRSGLSDALDFRLVKKLAAGADEADREAKATVAELKEHSGRLGEIKKEVDSARSATRQALAALYPEQAERATDAELLQLAASALDSDVSGAEIELAKIIHEELIALGGRVAALGDRSTAQRIEEVRSALTEATADLESWDASDGEKVRAWERSVREVGIDIRQEALVAVDREIDRCRTQVREAAKLRESIERMVDKIALDSVELERIQTNLAEVRETSTALVESLAALRPIIEASDICPVCERNFAETGPHSLLAHIDSRLDDLASHGQQLLDLRGGRDVLAAQIARDQVELTQLNARTLSEVDEQGLANRLEILVELSAEGAEVNEAMANGDSIRQRVTELEQSLESQHAATSEEEFVKGELAKYAAMFRIPLPAADFAIGISALLEQSNARSETSARRRDTALQVTQEAKRLSDALLREATAVKSVADVAERMKQSDDRVVEAKRRQVVAKEVHDAATQARAAIVHRVFTESLNDVWKKVFTRLAPNEGFIPSFGIPNATKKTFDINLETTNRDGATSGPPQMMLSAGNLNTAALSLFLALHLAVEPIVPCLVFDDPVQAMDEVHVAQFAALVRLLSKQNGRQVVIAVHERELFDYLTLELSPAYDGDQLITIELGERANDEDAGIVRHLWTPDSAIAV